MEYKLENDLKCELQDGSEEKRNHTLMSSPTELISLLALWLNQYDPTLFIIWSIL